MAVFKKNIINRIKIWNAALNFTFTSNQVPQIHCMIFYGKLPLNSDNKRAHLTELVLFLGDNEAASHRLWLYEHPLISAHGSLC